MEPLVPGKAKRRWLPKHNSLNTIMRRFPNLTGDIGFLFAVGVASDWKNHSTYKPNGASGSGQKINSSGFSNPNSC